MTGHRMNSRGPLLICCILATVMLTHCDESRIRQSQHLQQQQPQYRPRAARSDLQYKAMYVMCPPNFNRIGNECYYIAPNKLNWLDAYFECKDRNSRLAEPMKFEDKHLRRYLQKIQHHDDLWIGGTYNWKLNKWQWGHNGREMEYQSFSQMVPGSSRDLKFNCALLRAEQKFRWSAEECTKKINFICQHRMPLVSVVNRDVVYDRWNQTYPNQQANEKVVYIVTDPINRTRSDRGHVRIYNSIKQVFRSNPSIQPRPASNRRNPNRARKQPVPKVSNRTEYIPADVISRKHHLAQYAPDAHNELNGVGNGHYRNGYTVPKFNINLGQRYGRKRDPNNRYRTDKLPAMNLPHSYPHQHRHQSGTSNDPARKTTKHTQHPHPFYVTRTTSTTSTTTTTTTPVPTTTTTTRRSTTPTTATEEYEEQTTYSPPSMHIYQSTTEAPKHVMTPEEKRLHREALRQRLNRLTPEQREFFFQDRARRKLKKQEQLRKQQQQQQDNEVVHE